MRYRGLLYTIIALFGGVLFAGAAFVAFVDYRLTLEEAKAYARSSAVAYAQETEQNLAEMGLGIDWLARHIDPEAPDHGLTEEVRATARLMAARLPGLTALVFIDRQGILRFSTASKRAIGENMGDRAYFKAARDRNRDYYLGPTVRARGTDRPVHSYSRRIEAKGEFAGVVLASIRADRWSQGLDPLLREPGTRVRVLRADGEVVVNQVKDGRSRRVRALVGDALREIAPDPASSITAREALAEHNLVVEVSVPRAQAMAAWRERLVIVIVTGVLGLGALAVFGVFGYGALRREARANALTRHRTEALEARTRELDEALKTQKLLMAELEHRVRNSLNLAASMLSLQKSHAAQSDPEAMLDQARARILAIARVHDRLKGETSPITTRLDEYLRQLCDDLAANAGIDLHFEAKPVSVATKTAVPLGLIMTELFLNAAKHGRAGDAVRLDAAVTAEEGGVRIAVRDWGPGLESEVLAHTGSGLGTRIIDALTRQIDGEMTAENAEPGARFTIRVPYDPAED